VSEAKFARVVLKPLIWIGALSPAAWLVGRAVSGDLGVNPIETLTHETGVWALRLLLVTLAITPLRRLSGWQAAIRVRRLLGLFAFFYASIHFGIYLVLDQFFAFDLILKDIAKRPYITVGFTGLMLLVPLAATSTAGMIRRLGGARWRALHRLIYVSAACGVVHYLWLVKADTRRPLTYGAVLAVLLGARVIYRRRARAGLRVPSAVGGQVNAAS
jgi:sulfoxide reductase heme-binding subunit YedZ